jgi:hypothetical protein
LLIVVFVPETVCCEFQFWRLFYRWKLCRESGWLSLLQMVLKRDKNQLDPFELTKTRCCSHACVPYAGLCRMEKRTKKQAFDCNRKRACIILFITGLCYPFETISANRVMNEFRNGFEFFPWMQAHIKFPGNHQSEAEWQQFDGKYSTLNKKIRRKTGFSQNVDIFENFNNTLAAFINAVGTVFHQKKQD